MLPQPSENSFSADVAVCQDLGPGLREICAANRSDEKQVILIPVLNCV